ncbi:MAG TPA: hypothetical protein VE197_01490, partial [Mycobacterium sp.]|nr:hypothetical protein [Mycobacterium sp.]
MWTIILLAVSGLLSGGCGVGGGAVVELGVEKRRSDKQYRRTLVESWRKGIAELATEKEALGAKWYESLRP